MYIRGCNRALWSPRDEFVKRNEERFPYHAMLAHRLFVNCDLRVSYFRVWLVFSNVVSRHFLSSLENVAQNALFSMKICCSGVSFAMNFFDFLIYIYDTLPSNCNVLVSRKLEMTVKYVRT